MIVGLTGGIGSGKSLAASFFSDLGIPVVDADAVSRSITAAGGEACRAVAEEFGGEFISEDGSMNRAKMRELVFSDPSAKARLEALLHPIIEAKTRARFDELSKDHLVIIYDCPLLIEKKEWREGVDRILVVDVEPQEQIRRVGLRSGLSPSEVEAVMRNQASRQERLAAADDVIYNGGGIEDLQAAVKKICKKYLELAR